MILDDLSRWKNYIFKRSDFLTRAFNWIEEKDLLTMENGKYPIIEGIFALIMDYDTKEISECQFEAHLNYLDIQLIIQGQERIYYCPRLRIGTHTPYSKDDDIEFRKVKDAPNISTALLVKKDQFAIFWPGEWHMPCIYPEAEPVHVKKLVIKVSESLIRL
jgi:YhcH/YjgK/YiaL family protein